MILFVSCIIPPKSPVNKLPKKLTVVLIKQNAVNIQNGLISTTVNFLGNLFTGDLGGICQK